MTPPRTKKERAEAYVLADELIGRKAHTSEITFATGLSLFQVNRRITLLEKARIIAEARAQSTEDFIVTPDFSSVRSPRHLQPEPDPEDTSAAWREDCLKLVAAGYPPRKVAKYLDVPLYILNGWLADARATANP